MGKLYAGATFLILGVVSVSGMEEATAPSSAAVAEIKGVGTSRSGIESALDAQVQWMIFDKEQGTSRLKRFGEPTYYAPKEGDLFKVAIIDGKYYARLKDGTVFEEHWENQASFITNFTPFNTFIGMMDKKISSLDRNLAKKKERKEKVEAAIDDLKVQSKSLGNSAGNLKRRKHLNGKQLAYLNKLDHKIKVVKDRISGYEDEIKTLKKDMRDEQKKLLELKLRRQKYPAGTDIGPVAQTK